MRDGPLRPETGGGFDVQENNMVKSSSMFAIAPCPIVTGGRFANNSPNVVLYTSGVARSAVAASPNLVGDGN